MSTAVDALPQTTPTHVPRPTRATVALHPPTRSRYRGTEYEWTVCAPPVRFQRELARIFPERDPGKMHVVPMVQRCNNDLIGVGAQVDVEKDEMLERFVAWGNAIVSRLKPLNEWADITDPASGYPIHSQPGASPYPDVQGTQTLLRYDTQSTGCCHVLLHPSWGSSIYPATLFTSADPETFARVVGEVEREAQVGEGEGRA